MRNDNFRCHLEKEIKWQRVNDIPDFPIANFEEIKNKINSCDYAIAIDFITSNELAPILYGKVRKLLFHLFLSFPFIIALFSVILAIIYKKYWLIIGLPCGFIASLFASPYNPFKKFVRLIEIFLWVSFIWSFWTSKEVISDIIGYLIVCFIFPFWVRSYFYKYNNNNLIEMALSSEKLFIYLYQIGKLRLKENSTGKEFCL